jgi:Icc-related predicted phosphoesterase
MTKILAIGDPHGDLEKMKDASLSLNETDLILLTGDLGSAGLARKMAFENIERKKKGLEEKEYSPSQKKKAFMESYNSTIRLVKYLSTFAPVYTIFGNIEHSNLETRKLSKKIGLPLPFLYDELSSISDVRVINNTVANFHGVRIGGLEYFIDTNWVKDFKPSNFEEKMNKAVKETEKAKKVLHGFYSVDILICHQPPHGFLDEVTAQFAPKHWQGKHAGSKTILQYIKRKHPPYVFCGHIHEGKGKTKIGKTEVYNLGAGCYKLLDIKN